MGYVKMHVA